MRTASAKWGIVAAFAGIIAVFGCSSRPPVSDFSDGTPPGSAGGGTKPLLEVDSGAGGEGCAVTEDDGTVCQCTEASLFGDAPLMYFVLDRSGSMQADDKWTQVRLTVANVMRSLGPRAQFGATVFPGADLICSAGIEVLKPTPGDPPSSNGADGPVVSALIRSTAFPPAGGTPTASTLQAVSQRLSTVSGKKFVLLATDGAPNCSPNPSCGSDQCQLNIEHVSQDCTPNGPNCCEGDYASNCNDGNATVSAIAALKNQGITTYVIGLPGTQAYSALLDQMANAGGAPLPSEPKYFAVDTASSAAMLTVLRKIAAQITATCSFQLSATPPLPNEVNVYLDNVVLPQEPVNGWTLNGDKVTLVGDSCTRVKNGDVLDVRIIAGCPTVLPK